MPLLAQSGPGKVVALWGAALIRGADGKMRALKVGDLVERGDVLLTTQDGIVQIAPAPQVPARTAAKPAAPADDIDRVIAGLDQGETEVAPAAGLNGGGGGSLEEGLRVERIGEAIGAAGGLPAGEALPERRFDTGTTGVTLAAEPAPQPTPEPEPEPQPLRAGSTAISAAEEGAPTPLGLPAPTGAAAGATVAVTQVPGVGEIHRADGSLVSAGTTLTADELSGLVYVPPQEYDGLAPVGSFGYTVTSGSQTASGATTIALAPVNDAPLAQAADAGGDEDAVLPIALRGTDVDGTIAGVTIVSIPAGGTLLLGGGVTPVAAGQMLTAAQAGDLLFRPAADFHGDTAIVFTVTDNGGLVSAPATVSLVLSAVNDAPVGAADLASTPINTPLGSIAVLANDSDVDGDALQVSAASLVDPGQGSVSINPDGTLRFTPALDVSGPVQVQYTVTDPSGASSTATLTIHVSHNTPPTGTDSTITIAEDGAHAFSAADFGFADADGGQSLAAVRIDTLPAAGSLSFAGQPVTVGQIVPAAALAGLVFSPAPDANGTAYASFSFSVQDSAGAFDISPNTITLDATPQPDTAVIGGEDSGTVVEDITVTASGTLSIVDPDAGEQAFVPQANVAGAHGSFSIDAAGAWTYALDNTDPAVQALGPGQSLPDETFTVTSVDGTTRIVTVSIAGTNDLPVAQAAAIAAVEDGAVVSGSVPATDVDAGATLSYALLGAAPAGLSFAANGSYSFDPSHAAYQSLAQGQTLVITVPYQASDDQGAVSNVANLTITLTGVNDAAVVTGVAVGSVSEDGTVQATGQLGASDVDSAASFTAASVAGAYGDFAIDAAGQWTYTLRSADANVQALTSAQHPTESFSVTTADGTAATVTITVNGANEAPVAAVTAAGGDEDAAGIPVTLSASDADADGTIASFTVTALPAHGTLLFAGAPVALGAVIPATAGGATLSFVPTPDWNGSTSLSFSATDNEGATSGVVSQTIMVAAVNDAPTLLADVASTSINTPISGIVVLANDSDVDGDALTLSSATLADPSQGTVSINADGTLNFTPAPNVTGSVVVNYIVADPSGSTALSTLTIHVGDNTPPTGTDATITLAEDGSHAFSAADFGFADADSGQALAAVRIDALPLAGTLSFNNGPMVAGQLIPASALGSLVFTPAPDANGTAYASFSFSVQDSAGAFDLSPNSITLDVTPQPDAAAIGGGDSGAVIEDTTVTASGSLSIVDPDAGEQAFVPQADVAGAHGRFSIDADGAWTYTLDNDDPAVQALGQGQALPNETFTVQAIDGTTHAVTVSISGANDAPVVQASAFSVAEDGDVVHGAVLASDVDGPGPLTFALTGSAPAGLVFNADGSYTFDPSNPAYQSLADGASLVLTVPFTGTDGVGMSSAPADLVITVTGINDKAVVTGVVAGSVTEDGTLQAQGQLNVTDVDGAASFTAASVSGTYGNFATEADGRWTYTLRNGDANVQALTSAQHPTEVFDVTTADGTVQQITITVNGANEAPSATVAPASGDEDTTIAVTLAGTDVDGSIAGFTIVALPAHGTLLSGGAPVLVGDLVPATAGAASLTFVPAPDWHGSTELSFSAVDGEGASSAVVTQGITVIAVNDAPVAVDDVVSTPINTPLAAIAVLANDSDVDGDPLSVVSAALADPSRGTVTVNADGSLAFTPATNVTGPVQIDYTVADPSGATRSATVTVNVGSNTPPTGADATFTLPEDGSRAFAPADFGFADADSGQSLAAVRIDTLPAAGSLAFNGLPVVPGQVIPAATLGNLVFTPAPDANGLGYASFTFSAQDSAGAFDATPNTITLDVTPLPDAAAIAGDIGGATKEDTTPSASGTLTVVDPDAGEAAFQPQTDVAGAHGTFSVDAAGQWTYTLDNADPAVQALGEGQSLPAETFTVRSVDGTASVVTVTIHGTNDAPVAVADTGSLEENATLTTSAATGVLANDADTDAGDTKTVSGVAFGATNGVVGAGLNGTYGTLTLNADGSYSYSADRPAAEALAAGEVVTEQFAYTVRDASGATSTATLTFTITGQDDAPSITGPLTGTVKEDATLTATGTLTASDPDAGESGFVAQSGVAGTHGSFSITAAGVWTYTLDNAAAHVQALAGGASLTETFTVTTADGTTRDVQVTVQGANDAPVAVNAAFTVAEDAAIVHGSVGATDVDAGATLTYALTGAAPAGLAFNADGSYSFDPSHAAYQSLGVGQSIDVTVPYRATDDQGASSTADLVITVTGTNDGPVAQPDMGTLLENATLVAPALIGVLFNDTDVDGGDTKTVSGVAFGGTAGAVGAPLAGLYGTLTLGADGSVAYSANRPAAEALVVGQVVTEQFTYTMHDGSGATANSTITFTITGRDDAPTITGTFAGEVREDVTLSATGTLNVGDPDAGQSTFVAQSGVAGTHGSFSINAAGVWTYTLDNAAAHVQALGASSSLTETFTVATADGTTRNVVVTVNGSNDAPVVVADMRTTTEDTAVTGNVLANDSDLEGGALSLTEFSFGGISAGAGASTTIAGVGTLTVAANGAYTFTPAPNYAGAVPTVGYTVSDGSATSSSTLSLSITPVADAPTLVVNGSSTTGGTTTPPTIPPSVGLRVQYYDNIAAVGTSNASTIANVEAGVEASAATSTGTATDVAIADIAVDDAYRFTGYIHLTAGTTYTIGGYRDDTLMVKIGGTSVYAVGYNNWGTLSGTAFTPAVSGYYSLEVIAYNGDGIGSLDLTMAVGAAAAVDLNTSHFRLYPDTSAFSSSGTVVGPMVGNGDGGYYPTSVVGSEDTTIPLGTIAASLTDTDGSESLALRIGSIPVGATLGDGTHSFTATAGTTSVDVTGWALGSLTLTPPPNVAGSFALDVIATATDSNGSAAASQTTLPVNIVATADVPSLAGSTTLISMVQGSGATATLNLPVLATLADRDGSESLSVTIAGVPAGATLNHGSSNGAGTWTVSGADLADLTITLPAGHSGTTTMSVTAIATEASNGATASTTSSITLMANATSNNATVTGTSGNDDPLNGGGGNARNFIDGLAGNDTIDARGGDDLVRGGDGDDDITGGSGNDVLFGDAGDDILVGGTGSDRLVGGAGSDTLTGSATPGTPDSTTDVFAWSLADAGTPGAPPTDTITDFNASAASAGGDVLDLRDLLTGDALGAGNSAGNLANYLDFSVSTSGGVASTTIHISSSGAFTNGDYSAAQEDQAIVLQGVNLPTALGLASNASDAQIIQELVNRGKLIVDSGV